MRTIRRSSSLIAREHDAFEQGILCWDPAPSSNQFGRNLRMRVALVLQRLQVCKRGEQRRLRLGAKADGQRLSLFVRPEQNVLVVVIAAEEQAPGSMDEGSQIELPPLPHGGKCRGFGFAQLNLLFPAGRCIARRFVPDDVDDQRGRRVEASKQTPPELLRFRAHPRSRRGSPGCPRLAGILHLGVPPSPKSYGGVMKRATHAETFAISINFLARFSLLKDSAGESRIPCSPGIS